MKGEGRGKVLMRADGVEREPVVLVRVEHASYEFDQVGV
jgi:hypothetical protein